MKSIYLILFSLAVISCSDTVTVDYPENNPAGFLEQTTPLDSVSMRIMEGYYEVVEGKESFGDNVVLKWSRQHLSIFSARNAGYFVLQGGRIDTSIFFKGYWRYALNGNYGAADFIISSDKGASQILMGDSTDRSIIISGSFGNENNLPDKTVILKFIRPFSNSVINGNFYLVAHRGGGRNSDLLGASENTLEMINQAERLGANAVEIDVHLSKDGIPFLYHDPDINPRLTEQGILFGNIEDFTFAQLRTFIKLKNGEKIPSLEKALEFIIEETDLKFVWLDLKSERNEIETVVQIQSKYLNLASMLGRDIEILLGVPEEKVDHLRAYPSFTDVLTISELNINTVRELNSIAWAPRWTQGLQINEVREMHAEGRKSIVWTLDEPEFIKKYILEGEFDGIVSNFTPLIAYYYYSKP